VREQTGRDLPSDALVLGFARRATAYKRAHLVVSDVDRLRALGRGRMALVFGGKAHPRDEEGKETIRHIVEVGRALARDVPIVWLPGYGVELARTIVSGADVWLNTPVPPLEASGTSGMKAAHNGVPSLSVLDGWWLEGCVEGSPAGESAVSTSNALRPTAMTPRNCTPSWSRRCCRHSSVHASAGST
jgi:starch phosphorylase